MKRHNKPDTIYAAVFKGVARGIRIGICAILIYDASLYLRGKPSLYGYVQNKILEHQETSGEKNQRIGTDSFLERPLMDN